MADAARATKSGTTTIKERTTVVIYVLFAIFEVSILGALVESVNAASTTGGRFVAGIFMGFWFAVVAWGLPFCVRRRTWLEISDDTIKKFEGSSPQTPKFMFSRSDGDDLAVRRRLRHSIPLLTVTATGAWISLNGYGVQRVEKACAAHGWQFHP